MRKLIGALAVGLALAGCAGSSSTSTGTGTGTGTQSTSSNPTGTGTGTGPSTGTSPTPAVEGPGSSSHATDAQFCSTHSCIPSFPNGNGTIVQCADSEWSHSGGLSGACSDHGGES